MECTDCGEEGHKAGWPFCPGRKRVVKPDLEKTYAIIPEQKGLIVKKPWVKADSLTGSNNSLTGEDVRQPESNGKFDKKAYQREYMRRVRHG